MPLLYAFLHLRYSSYSGFQSYGPFLLKIHAQAGCQTVGCILVKRGPIASEIAVVQC